MQEGSSVVGAYDKLSPGNQRIADALFDSQSIGPNGGEAWSLDKIAATHQDGRGWGEIFNDMKSQGLTDAKNLGELVSGRYQARTTTATKTGLQAVTVTNGSGRTETIHTSGRDRDAGPSSGNGQGAKAGLDSGGNKGIVTGRGSSDHAGAGAGQNTAIVTARGNSANAGGSGGGRGRPGNAD